MDELSEKRKRLFEFLNQQNLDAVYLCQVANFAWYTGGLEPVVMISSDRAEAGLLVTRDRAYVVCNSIEHPRLRDEDRLAELGYEFHVSPWYQGAPRFDDLVQGLRWAADWPLPGAPDMSLELTRLRYRLTAEEMGRYRQTGMHTGQAIEAAARRVQAGMSEVQIAGLMAQEALERGLTPTMLLVGADERIYSYRHPIPTQKVLERYCMMAICARRYGLVTSATRFVHFGAIPDEIKRKQAACAYVDVVYNANTTAGRLASDIFREAVNAYADVGFPGEWQKHNQGGAAGYLSRDWEGTPTCEEIVVADQGFAWNPSITGMKFEDTMIVHEDGCEFITSTGEWPAQPVEFAGRIWQRPAVLER